MSGTGRDQFNAVAGSIPFDNTESNYTADNVEDALKQVSDVIEGNFNFSNATAFEAFSDIGLSNTTSNYPNYVNKLSGTNTENLSGKFIIQWYSEISNSGNNNITWVRVQWKRSSDTAWLNLTEIDILIPRANSYVLFSGFRVVDVDPTDTIDFRIQFARGSGTARIQNANLYIFRVETTPV